MLSYDILYFYISSIRTHGWRWRRLDGDSARIERGGRRWGRHALRQRHRGFPPRPCAEQLVRALAVFH